MEMSGKYWSFARVTASFLPAISRQSGEFRIALRGQFDQPFVGQFNLPLGRKQIGDGNRRVRLAIQQGVQSRPLDGQLSFHRGNVVAGKIHFVLSLEKILLSGGARAVSRFGHNRRGPK